MATRTVESNVMVADSALPAPEHRRISPGRVGAWAALGIIILITLCPFYWMLRPALCNSRSLFSEPASILPVDFTWGAFERVFGLATQEEARAEGGSGASVNFVLYLRNSVIFASVAPAGQVFFSALAAYAFARLKWPGRDIVFTLFLTALMVPPIFTALPNFIFMRNLGLINTFPGLILPYFFMTPFAIFFLRQFFLDISSELEEAARLDGASHARIFFQIILPMSSAPIVTLSILTFINMWNEYLWPLLIGNNESTRVLTVALGVFRTQSPAGSPDWAGLLAAVLGAPLPLVIIFLLFAKRVVNNIGFSGMK